MHLTGSNDGLFSSAERRRLGVVYETVQHRTVSISRGSARPAATCIALNIPTGTAHTERCSLRGAIGYQRNIHQEPDTVCPSEVPSS